MPSAMMKPIFYVYTIVYFFVKLYFNQVHAAPTESSMPSGLLNFGKPTGTSGTSGTSRASKAKEKSCCCG
jgi:hypothetical protein